MLKLFVSEKRALGAVAVSLFFLSLSGCAVAPTAAPPPAALNDSEALSREDSSEGSGVQGAPASPAVVSVAEESSGGIENYSDDSSSPTLPAIEKKENGASDANAAALEETLVPPLNESVDSSEDLFSAAPELEVAFAAAETESEPDSVLLVEPDAVESNDAEPDAVEPDAAEPDAVESNAAEPDAVEPDEKANIRESAFSVPQKKEILAMIAALKGPRKASFIKALNRSGPYIEMIERELLSRGLPQELVYLPLIESHFQFDAVSSAGAVGLWQFIDSTARASGLQVNWWVDERLDPELSTIGALGHLQELYDQFEDWELTLAAYNAGNNGIKRALDKTGAKTFWELAEKKVLRTETKHYVPKFYAAIGAVRELQSEDADSENAEEAPDFVSAWGEKVAVDSPVSLKTIAGLAGVPLKVVQKLNPALLRGCTPPGVEDYFVRVPEGKGALVANALKALPDERRLTFLRHKIQRGDTLWSIARRYNTRHAAIAELNDISNPKVLRPGAYIAIPVAYGAKSIQTTENFIHVVRKGESLWGISRSYGVALSDLIKRNNLNSNSVIRPGDKLIVSSLSVGPS